MALKAEHPSIGLLACALERAKLRTIDLAELIGAAEAQIGEGAAPRKAELYQTWIAFNADHRLLHFAYFNLSIALRAAGDLVASINALQEALRLDPSFTSARINLGRAYEDAGQVAEAVRQWRALVDGSSQVTPELVAHRVMALEHIGRVLEPTERLDLAEEALRAAVELRPEKTEAAQHWIALRQRQCKWPALQPSERASRKQMIAAMSPISLAAFSDDPMFQLARANRYSRTFVGRPEGGPLGPPAAKRKLGFGKRLKVGYVSSDLREHAVGFALAEVFELHDKSAFEIFAYYCGEPRAHDRTQERIKSQVDRWQDIGSLSDLQAARRIMEDEIDVLVDVNGYTKHARTKIFAYRPAPVIVNWCGYPGTMGSPYHQYLIADDKIIPPECELFYSERVLRLPCNQPLDRKRRIDPATPTRADVGLPEGAFVYASFNGMQKVTPASFARWMAILADVPNSVLWLLSGDGGANERLKEAAARGGVAAERLVFARKAPNPQHLARIVLADLFLDTMPYGAHSTAADALTMGLPIMTIAGKSFASRFCASVVSAAGLPDLVCQTSDEYVRRAIEFGRNPSSLARYRERLRSGRELSALRDVPALTKRLEGLFWQMQSEAERGVLPTPDLTNLDVYFEIGAELDLETIETLDWPAYRELYADRLKAWDRHEPIAPDRRFWRDGGRSDASVAAAA